MGRTKKMSVFEESILKLEETLDLRSVSLEKGELVRDATQTGSLSVDLILGGGFIPARFTVIFGKEAAGKSTFMYRAMATGIAKDSFIFHFDHEGSADPWYLSKQGVRLDWAKEKEQRYRYYQPDTGQQTFKFIHRILNDLEDRDSGPVQCVFFIDSLVSMLPEDLDENDDKNPTAMQARMFSDNFKLVKTKLSQKRCSLIASNQIRTNPRQMYGNPEYEPGGEAIRHYSDCRIKLTPCSVPKGKGRILEEPCWDGNGIDRYVYSKVMTVKNKMFSPFRETIVRFCFENRGQPGYGLDPVYDTYMFLDAIGAVTTVRGGLKINLDEFDFKCDWAEFKAIILNPKGETKLREYCYSLFDSGRAFEMYFNHIGGGAAPVEEEVEKEDDKSTDVEEEEK